MKKFSEHLREISESKEYVLWGVPKGKTDQLYAQVLYTQGKTPADVDRVKKLAGNEGWHSFRVQVLDKSKPFDAGAAFVGAINKKKGK